MRIRKEHVITAIFIIIVIIAFAMNLTYASENSTTLYLKEHTIKVHDKEAKVYRIEQADGTWGYRGFKGSDFNVTVKNLLNVPTVIHWHGLILPNNQDGVPYVTQPPIQPGESYQYNFPIKQAGTYWMHSHFGLQTQRILSAPLILEDPNNKANEKEVILFLNDFSFKDPETILKDLQASGKDMQMQMDAKPKMQMAGDLNDVTYDAYLTNYRTLNDPDIVYVKPGETVRLRVIDAGAASNFYVNTGKLSGTLIAVDGEDIKPYTYKNFQVADGQRIDIRVKIPKGEGVYPILAQAEGTKMQTGLILATANTKIPKFSETAAKEMPAVDNSQDMKVQSLRLLSTQTPGQTLTVNLNGNMMTYVWTINDEAWPKINALKIGKNKRIEIVFNNLSGMSHPMHLHGHVFMVTEINGKPTKVMRDTVLVMPHSTVKIQFDSDNPGNWMLHCHILYHQQSGMMTIVSYDDVKVPDVSKQHE